MGFADFLNNIKRIKKANIDSIKQVSEEFNPNNGKASQPDPDKYENSKNEISYINGGIDKLREIIASNNQNLANLEHINNNISEFFNALFSDKDLIGPDVVINNTNKKMQENEVEQKLKIIELFSTVFSKYDDNAVNNFIIKLINNGKDSPVYLDIKNILQEWRNQYDINKKTGQITLNSFKDKDVFAEKIIEESEKYDISGKYKQALKTKEAKEIKIREYTVKGFDFKGDDLMSMFLTNPIVEKLMIDPIIISLHKTKDAVLDAKDGVFNFLKEQNNYYGNYTLPILDMFENKHIRDALRSNLTEPARDDKENVILDKNNNPMTQYDILISQLDKIKNTKLRTNQNKLLKELLENSNFYLKTGIFRKGTSIDQSLLNQLSQTTNPDDAYKLLEANCIKRSVNIFSEEFAEILLGATKNCKNKKEISDIKNTVYMMGAMDPSLLGEKDKKVKELLSFRKQMADHDYKKKYNTPLEDKHVKDMENKINKDYAYELENMKSIEQEITNIGRASREKECRRKSSRVESDEEFIDKIERNLQNGTFTQLSDADKQNVEDLLQDYKDLYKTVSKSVNTYSVYSTFIKKIAGRSR